MTALSRRRSSLAVLVVLATLQPTPSAANDREQARISGVVSDRQQAVYQAPDSVSIRCVRQADCGKTFRSQPLSPTGEFKFDVPPGVYEIKTEVRRAFPYKRAPLSVHSGHDVFVRLVPRIQILGVSLNVAGPDIAHKAPPVKYEFVPLSKDQKALMEYETRQGTESKISYTYAVLSYGNWSFVADNMSIDEKEKTITLSGRPVIYRGSESFDARTVSFKSLLETPIWPPKK